MELVQLGFDYGQLDSDTREVVQQRTGEIKALVRRAAQDIVEIGQKLTEVKARLGHGQFGGWLRAEFEWGKDTAARFMQVAERFGDNSQIAKFAPSALYLLAAPNTPEPARQEAIERAEAGEAITYSAAREIVDAHKDLSRLCPYCGCVYSVEDLEGGVSCCPNCGKLHSYSGIRDVEKYGPLPNATPPHVSFNAGNNEWYTPHEYIAAAHQVMGAIDLDPASSHKANEIVDAGAYFTTSEDGLAQNWFGRVWLNPPYATPLIGQFCAKLAQSYEDQAVYEAIVLVNNATETAWFERLVSVASAVVFPFGRVRFLDERGNPSGAPLQGQAVVYIGKNSEGFLAVFKQFGWGARL